MNDTIEKSGSGITPQSEMERLFGEPIHVYTRKEAIDDGVLVEVLYATSRETGIRFPVAMTREVYERYVALPEDYKGCQDEEGRLWDVIYMLAFKIRTMRDRSAASIEYQLNVRNPVGRGQDQHNMNEGQVPDDPDLRLVTLKCLVGPGDDAEAVMTIMLPWED